MADAGAKIKPATARCRGLVKPLRMTNTRLALVLFVIAAGFYVGMLLLIPQQ